MTTERQDGDRVTRRIPFHVRIHTSRPRPESASLLSSSDFSVLFRVVSLLHRIANAVDAPHQRRQRSTNQQRQQSARLRQEVVARLGPPLLSFSFFSLYPSLTGPYASIHHDSVVLLVHFVVVFTHVSRPLYDCTSTHTAAATVLLVDALYRHNPATFRSDLRFRCTSPRSPSLWSNTTVCIPVYPTTATTISIWHYTNNKDDNKYRNECTNRITADSDHYQRYAQQRFFEWPSSRVG